MTDWKFNRGLDCDFVSELNELYDNAKCGWWRDLMDDRDLFLAIRDNFVNFYYRGCSLLKLEWKPNTEHKVVGQIHYKYLLRPSMSTEYIRVRGGRPVYSRETVGMFLDCLDVKELKKSVRRYAEAEKSGVHDIIMCGKNDNVLDVEIAFRVGSATKRIDIATLQETEQGPTLKFFEAKHFKNKELKATEDAKPKVINQLNEYTELLTKYGSDIIKSYRKVGENLQQLHGFPERNPNLVRQLERIAEIGNKLTVDCEPKLVVFGFDRDQRDGAWKSYRRKLEKILGERCIESKGAAADVDLRAV